MRKVGSLSSRLMRSQAAAEAAAVPEVTFQNEKTTAGEPSATPNPPTTPPLLGLKGRASSWRQKSAPKQAPRKASTFAELQFLCKLLKNVRETKINELLEQDYLCKIEFDNKSLSMDEVHMAAVLMLERAVPGLAFSDKTGLQCLFDFVSSVRKVYVANPYHDFRHAVDVMQFTNFMLQQDDVSSQLQHLPCETKFVALVACLCHDAGHDGLTNAIHRKMAKSPLVERFGQESPLERLHFDHCERLVQASSLLDIAELDHAQVIAQCRTLILGTDMEKHSALLASFAANPSNNLLQMVIKIADISNVTRDFEEARVWSKRLDAEMKAHPGAPAVSPMTLCQSVTGFSRMFAIPLAQALASSCLPETGRMLVDRIESNLAMWAKEDASTSNPGL